MGDSRFVLLGEGSHGTHDFYHERAEITKRLITEKGGIPRFFLDLRNGARTSKLLTRPRLERAIGVIYRPETERVSHYFRADVREQFDGVFHFDETRAVEPLEKPPAERNI